MVSLAAMILVEISYLKFIVDGHIKIYSDDGSSVGEVLIG